MSHEVFIEICKELVLFRESDSFDGLKIDDVFVIWSCKTLQNSKCIISAKNKGACMYEFTMNGDKNEVYVDVYTKVKHQTLNTETLEIFDMMK